MLKEYREGFLGTHCALGIRTVLTYWYLSYSIRFNFLPSAQPGLFTDFSYIAIFLLVITVYVYEKFDLYKSFRLKSIFHEIALVSRANFIVFAILIFTLYFLKDDKISRIHLAIFLVTSQALLIS